MVADVFINPSVILVRGYCPACKIRSGFKAIDLVNLAERIDEPGEYETEPQTWANVPFSVKKLE